MKVTSLYISIFMAAFLISCSSDDNEQLAIPYNPETQVVEGPSPTYSSGSANFSTYVAVGNSLTAGYSDNALFRKGQLVSFPNILAQRFSLAGGGDFTIPLMDDDLGGMLIGGQPLFGTRLIFDISAQLPMNISGTPSTDVTNIVAGPYNNMGVPGAKSYHLLANGYGSLQALQTGQANPYYVRMASSPSASVLEDAMAMSPTFFSLWIGANDVLGYATSGGSGDDHNETGNLDPSTYASNDITNNNVFGQVYGGILQGLTSGGAQGVVINLPSVTSTPFFTTVPHNPIPMDAQTAAFVNNAYGDYNNGLLLAESFMMISEEERIARTISFEASATNAVVIEDEYLTDLSALGLPSYRQATEADLVILPARSFIGTLADPNDPSSVNGVGVPLKDNWILVSQEQDAVENAITAYNQTIETLASQFDLAFFDVNAFFNTVATTGVQAGSATITTDYVTGGAFSLDGIHPSPRGYAVIANNIIGVINTKYGANLPTVNPVEYTGLYVN